MEATLQSKGYHKKRKVTTKGQKKHWAVWLLFATVFAVIITKAVMMLYTIFF